MIVYNITIKIFPAIEAEWVQWQKEEHIPEVMASGCFTDYKFYRLQQEDEDGLTYVVQYFANTMDEYNHYIEETAPSLREKALTRWGNRFIAFRTVMQTVD